MSVSHSAVVCFGCQIELLEGSSIDMLGEWLGKECKDLDLGFVEWGAKAYGRSGGYFIGDRRCTDMADDIECKSLIVDNPPSDTKSRIDKAVSRGGAFKIVSRVGWWFSNLVW